MPTTKHTVSVRLDAEAARRLEQAARLTKQSRGAFLEKAGDERARSVLLQWAVERHRNGDRGLSELAAETGLAVEEIVDALSRQGQEAALAMFLSSCRTIAQAEARPEFLRLAEEAVQTVVMVSSDTVGTRTIADQGGEQR
jgi:predicted transcriptional regulator